MQDKLLESYTLEEVTALLKNNVDAIVLVDTVLNRYRAISRNGIFTAFIDENGDYHE